MIIEFETDSLRELIERGKTSDRKYRKLQSDAAFMSDFRKVFNTLYIAKDTEELKFYGRLPLLEAPGESRRYIECEDWLLIQISVDIHRV